MFSSSVRRVVSSAVSSGPQTGVVSALASSTSKAAPVFVRSHQRRCSSSKPSRSDNDSNDISAGQSVPTSSSARGEGKASGEKRKRKSNKDASDRTASLKKLPSVPNTHHMSQEALGLSSFFSLHRPISVTQTMPRAVSDEHFASIFTPRTKANRMSNTMSTLSETIDQLEGPMAQMTIGGQQEQGMGDAMHKVDIKNPDGSESSMYLQIDTMSGEFLPFRPPPLPQAQAAGEATNAIAEAESVEDVPQHRVYKALFTIEESTDPDGQIRIMAHSPRILQDAQPKSFLERLALRQLKFDEANQGRRDMHAISVKRQRKLKMKKKKYKKLMKRTRNLRRKLDRT
ncbi:hypothetical protein B0T10DRAFT_13457 [Thelonectria olida]|uniref:Small ribosomal subunit protein mS38 n=1 Tax=Thelonectria olida TaxID=1576542 RepID=A0A9P8WHI0_9HYPO|nr:hypothetical protein B0T10DRAFT_13457 [Thelonectria olida]